MPREDRGWNKGDASPGQEASAGGRREAGKKPVEPQAEALTSHFRLQL